MLLGKGGKREALACDVSGTFICLGACTGTGGNVGFDWRCVVQCIHMAVLWKGKGKRVSCHVSIHFSLKTDVIHKKIQD